MKNFSVFERLYGKLKDEFDRGLWIVIAIAIKFA